MTDETLADIILAECFGQAWLVRGEQHIDNLLGNMVGPDVSIEVVACESKVAVDTLWRQWNEGPTSEMWLIHPGVVNRVRGVPASSSIRFAAWSAALEAEALRVIEVVAKGAMERPGATIALVRHVVAGGGRAAEDLGGLRCTLVEGQLSEAGVAPERMLRETTPAANAADAERVDVLLR